MRVFLQTVITACAVWAGTFAAVSDSIWNHNGSQMLLREDGSSRSFVYLTPKDGLPVSPGTVLFEGRREGLTYSGEASLFSTKCGTIRFPVRGSVSEDQLRVTMTGKAPRRNANCEINGDRDEVLVFEYVSSDAPVNYPSPSGNGTGSSSESSGSAQTPINWESHSCVAPGIKVFGRHCEFGNGGFDCRFTGNYLANQGIAYPLIRVSKCFEVCARYPSQCGAQSVQVAGDPAEQLGNVMSQKSGDWQGSATLNTGSGMETEYSCVWWVDFGDQGVSFSRLLISLGLYCNKSVQ